MTRCARPAAAVLLCLLLAATMPPLHAQAGMGVDALVTRAVAYVEGFERDFGSVVSEERYEQEVRPAVIPVGAAVRRSGRGPGTAVLVSDFLLVQIPGQGWWPFRDVFEHNGRPVRDRQDRLTALFLGGSKANAIEQAGRLMDEGARYNIGDVNRNINLPTLALAFLGAGLRRQFTFSLGGVDRAAEGLVLEYRETGRPTVVRTTNNRDLPVSGRYWVDEATGTIRRTELHAVDTAVEGHITVTYAFDAGIGMWAPARMEERYRRQRDSSEVRGVATYSRFRRFSVSTSEEIAK